LEEDGGQGASLMEAVIAIQEVARVCPKSGDVIQASNFGAIRTFAEYASPELKERYLPDLLAGRSLLALAMSEPEAGSAVTDLKTSAVADGDAYLLNGSKAFSTHSPDASAFLVYVRFAPGAGGIGSVIVDRDAPGLTVAPPADFMSTSSGASCSSMTAGSRPRTWCWGRADSSSRSVASTSSASGTPPARWPSAIWPFHSPAGTRSKGSSSAARCANSRRNRCAHPGTLWWAGAGRSRR
jgi:hypothetical protein